MNRPDTTTYTIPFGPEPDTSPEGRLKLQVQFLEEVLEHPDKFDLLPPEFARQRLSELQQELQEIAQWKE